MLKKMSILLVTILLLVTLTVPVYAKLVPNYNADMAGGSATIEEKVKIAMKKAMNIASTIGVAVAVILLIVVAVKYMSAAPSDKAEIKKHIVVYVVGAVLLLCASGVLQLIKNLGNEIVGSENSSSITPNLPKITNEN